MKIVKVHMPEVAYATFGFCACFSFRGYCNVYGKLYGCNDNLLLEYDQMYAQVYFNGSTEEEAREYAFIASPFDMRTLEMVLSGCCPPGLINEILSEGPG